MGLLNSDFEIGDSRFWLPNDRKRIDTDISSVGANGSKYSLMIKKYTSNRVRQTLDTRCITAGQEFSITAKFKYVAISDLATGMECSPTVLNLYSKDHCPTVRIVGSGCTSETGSVGYTLWNDIENFEWSKDDFNDYEKILTIDSELASCEVSIYFHFMLNIYHYFSF